MKNIKTIIFTLILLLGGLLLTGCGKLNDKQIRKDFLKQVKDLKSYYMEGNLELTNNDDTYHYDVKVSYKNEDYYKVILTNKNNNYEQTILRNKDGVYVVTPSLNKSFKFQSDWPYNNSQSYLLQSIANDLEKDNTYKFEQKNKDYQFTTKVNYPNNPNYTKQTILLDKNGTLKKVEVSDDKDIVYIRFEVTNLDKKSVFDDKHFELEETSNNIVEDPKEEKPNDEQPSMSIDDSVFPLYLPTNTTLSSKEVIDTTAGQRIIMTFAGDNPFIFVQETIAKEKELTVVPTYGEPHLLIDTVGSLTDISYTWASNGIEYYIVSDVMNKQELLEVAKSINVVATIGEK